MMKLTALACGLVALSGAAAQTAKPTTAECTKYPAALMTISQEAKATDDLSTFIEMIEAVDLLKTEVQKPASKYTVFAPSNTAFAYAKLALDAQDDTDDDSDGVADMLLKTYQTHLVAEVLDAADLRAKVATATNTIQTVAGSTITIGEVEGAITLSDDSTQAVVATVIDEDNKACNSVIHVIDRVFTTTECTSIIDTAEAQTTPNLATFISAVKGTAPAKGMFEDDFNNQATAWTVFAPSNAAFTKAEIKDDTPQEDLDAVLKMHISKVAPAALSPTAANKVTTEDGRVLYLKIAGSDTAPKVAINDGPGTDAKLLATAEPGLDACGSKIYVIDTIIPAMPCESITTVATADEDLKVFVETLKESKYDTDASNTESDLTVFAPTDAAFEVEAVVALISDADQASKDAILGTHIIKGAMMSTALKTGTNLTTITGEQLLVTKTATAVTITDYNGNVAKVTGADMNACGSVVHKIDNVLTPNPDAEVSAALATKAGLGVMAFVMALFFM